MSIDHGFADQRAREASDTVEQIARAIHDGRRGTFEFMDETWEELQAIDARYRDEENDGYFAMEGARKDARAALAALATPPIKPDEGEWYKHVQRGTLYQMLGTAELQASQPQCEHAALAIYRGEDGKLWARNTAEFFDGRFVAAPTGGVV